MIDITDGQGLLREIEAAEKVRRQHLENTVLLVRQYVGNWYRKDSRRKPTPENMVFAYVATLLPQLIFDNPEVTCSAKRAVTYKPVADWMRMAINGWIKEVNLQTELEAACLDMLFGFGVMKVGIEPRGDFMANRDAGVWERFNMEALQPYAIRLEPETFIIDSQCKSPSQARILGHQFGRDLEDLLQDTRYDQKLVKQLTPDDDQREYGKGERDFRSPPSLDSRKRVTLYELYLPEHKKILTLAKNAKGDAVIVRPAADYVGPSDGPYILFGIYGVPNQPYPLSPICAMAEQFQELNAHAYAAGKEAAAHKTVGIVNGNNKELTTQIHSAPSGSILSIANFTASEVAKIELGGASDFRLKYIGLLRDRLDRVVGTSDAQRGKTSGVTATEISIVNDDSDSRTSFINNKYRECVKQVLRRAGWYMFYDPAVVMPISWTDHQSGEQKEGIFLGGQHPGQEDVHWLDFFIDIEPYSMKRVDPQVMAQQAQQMFLLAQQVAPLIVQFPWINWRALLDDFGDANNIPDFAERILNQQGLAMIQQQVLPGQIQSLGGQPGQPPQLPPTANPALRMGMMGAPVANMQPNRGAMVNNAGAGGGGGGGQPGPAQLALGKFGMQRDMGIMRQALPAA